MENFLRVARRGAIAVALAFATFAANAVEVSLATADATPAATTSFNSAGGWPNGAAPSAGNDYLVNLGANAGLCLPTASAAFAGDSLAIGDATAPGRVDFKGNNQTITVGNMTWARGLLHAVAGSGTMNFSGRATVTSGADDPFVLEGLAGEWVFNGSQQPLYGGEDAVLLIRSAGPTRSFKVTGSSWGWLNFDNYAGKLIVDNATLAFSIFGYGAPQFVPDAITLRNNGRIAKTGAFTSWNNTRAGITVEESGGEIGDDYGGTLYLSCAVTGGPVRVTATLQLRGAMRVSEMTVAAKTTTICSTATLNMTNLVVAGGELQFEAGATYENAAPTPVVVKEGGRLRIENAPSGDVAVILGGGSVYTGTGSGVLTNLVYDGGSAYIRYSAATGPDCLSLAGAISGIDATTPLKITSDVWPAAETASGRYRLLAVPTASLALAEEMVDLSAMVFDDRSRAFAYAVVEEGGMRYLEVWQTSVPHISLVAGDAGFSATTSFNGDGTKWSDGAAPRDGFVYDVALGTGDGQAMRLPSAAAAFAGSQLCIGGETAAGRVDAGVSKTYTVGSMVWARGVFVCTNGSTPEIAGKTDVLSGADDPFVIQGDQGGFNTGTGVLQGGAEAVLLVRGTGAPLAFALQAGQTWGNGGFGAYGGKVILDNVCSVHGNFAFSLPSFVPDAVTLRNGSALVSTAAYPTWNSNAGVKVEEAGGYIGCVYTGILRNHLSFSGGPLRVAHPNMLFLGSAALSDFVVYGNGSKVTFMEGATLDNARYALEDGTLRFAPGVVFAHAAPVPAAVTGGTLRADAAALAHLALSITNATLVARGGDEAAYETSTLTNAFLAGGATIVFDSNPAANECDTLVFAGSDPCGFSQASPLKLGLSAPMPYEGLARRYEVLVFPAGVRTLAEEDFDVSGIAFDMAENDGVYVVRARIGRDAEGRQHVTVARLPRKRGTMVLFR